MGFSIELIGKDSTLSYKLNEPITLDENKEWEICLTSFVCYNSINNVTHRNNEMAFADDNDNEKDLITIDYSEETNEINPNSFRIPPGTYEVEDILREINGNPMSKENSFQSSANPVTRKVEVFCKNKRINFTSSRSIGQLLGFSKQVIEKGRTVHSNILVDIYPVNAIRIRSNLINSNYENGKSRGNIIYSFPLDSKPGTKIVQIPSQFRYYPLNTYHIREVYIEIVDQNNRVIDFDGETISLEFYIKSI